MTFQARELLVVLYGGFLLVCCWPVIPDSVFFGGTGLFFITYCLFPLLVGIPHKESFMTKDIVERLRDVFVHEQPVRNEAADEIERLRALVETADASGEDLSRKLKDRDQEIRRLRAERDAYKKELDAIAFAQTNGLGERDTERDL